jgi:voltage-gated potassium channel
VRSFQHHSNPWRKKLYTIIFEAETPPGKAFDILLLWAIVLSVFTVCLESIPAVRGEYGSLLFGLEWFFTVLFSLEYLLRLLSVRKPLAYVFSFYGLVDLLAVLPTYLSLYHVGAQSLLVIRSIRLIRIFRLFKLKSYVGEAEILNKALLASRHKITVFLVAVFSIVLFMGALMYVIEGEKSGFTSIPTGMYWAVVTMTTVGYGDLVPKSDIGKAMASLLMIMGYGIIAVPTGIVTAEIASANRNQTTRTCPNCMLEGHTPDAKYCRLCGKSLHRD